MLAMAMVAFVFCCAVRAEAPTRVQLEATFLYKFLQYVEWPAKAHATADGPYVIGILGSDGMGSALDEIVAGEQLNGRKIEARHFSNVSQALNCHVLFISSSESGRLPAILDKLKGKSILTVSDMPDFAQRGGIIGFYDQDRKIRFQINIDAAQHAKLSISAKLLQLAQIVHTGERH
jgi:hypothetical protein